MLTSIWRQVPLGYEDQELDEIEKTVAPLAQNLAKNLDDAIIPRRGS